MSYREPLATTTGFGILKPGTGLTVSNGVLNVTPVTLFDQAYFYSTVTQTNPVASTTNLVTYNNAAINVGIILISPTEIQVSKTANYNFQFVMEFTKTGGQTATADAWIIRNGVNYPDTNSQVSVTGNLGTLVASWNYTLALSANDIIQTGWQSADIAMVLQSTPVQILPSRPATPSVRTTIIQI
jgi:hypothetical protein